MADPCSPLGAVAARATHPVHHAGVHHAHAHSGVGAGHTAPHAHAAAAHAPVYGPPAPVNPALCSKVPGTTLAAGPGAPPVAPEGAMLPGSAPAPAPVGTAGPVGSPGAVGGVPSLAALPGIGSLKGALLAAALAGGLGTAAILDMPPAEQPTTMTARFPDLPLTTLPAGPDNLPDITPAFTPRIVRAPAPAATAPAPATPVPEPASILMLALGGLLATFARHRRR